MYTASTPACTSVGPLCLAGRRSRRLFGENAEGLCGDIAEDAMSPKYQDLQAELDRRKKAETLDSAAWTLEDSSDFTCASDVELSRVNPM